jgi:hypothetical protein
MRRAVWTSRSMTGATTTGAAVSWQWPARAKISRHDDADKSAERTANEGLTVWSSRGSIQYSAATIIQFNL